MNRERAKPIIEKAIQADQWEAYVPKIKRPSVQVSKRLLSKLGGNDGNWNIETLAVAVLKEELPNGFDDESPTAEARQIEIPFKTTMTELNVIGFLISHNGQMWFGSERFI
jgi:hypothetical protein